MMGPRQVEQSAPFYNFSLDAPNGARDEFLLAATAENLPKLAKLLPMPDLTPA
jgi:hypothetical protein